MAESDLDFVQLMGLVEDTIEETIEEFIDPSECPMTRKPSISSVKSNGSTHPKHENSMKKDDGVQMEESSKGKIHGSVLWGYFSSGTNRLILILLAVIFPIVEVFGSGSDYWLSIWYNYFLISKLRPAFVLCLMFFLNNSIFISLG